MERLRNHKAAVALFVAHYNFCRVHEAIRMTPAVALGVVDRTWSVAELVETAMSIAADSGRPSDPYRAGADDSAAISMPNF